VSPAAARLALVLLALGVSGCATRAGVGALQSDVSRVRTELAELRLAQDRVLAELRSLDARASESQATLRESAAELAGIRVRLQAAEEELQKSQAAIARPPAAVIPPAAASTPAPVPPPPAALPGPAEGERPRDIAGDEPAEQAYAAALNTFRAREHGQAVLDFLDFIAKYPAHALAPNAQYWIGEAYFVQRDYRHALVEFQQVLEMAPTASTVPDALLRIGMCHANLREPASASAAWQRIVRDHPLSDAAGQARGFLRARMAPRRP
jgi:tol-pal system protein YbgF